MSGTNTSSLHPHAPRVLILRIGAMGDVLHALPAVTALRARLPGVFLGWALEPRWRALLEAKAPAAAGPPPLVDRIHPVATRDWKQSPFSVSTLRQIAALRRDMRAERYDVCVDLQGAIRSAAVGRLSGATRLIGPHTPRERQARALYGERVRVHARHVIDQACELLSAALPADPPLLPAPIRLPVDEAAERWCDHLVQPTQPFILLAPTAGWGAKQWPAEHFAALAALLAATGLRILVNAASAEDPVVRTIIASGAAEAVPCSLAELIALTRRAALVIGGDTGPLHLAAALGRPVVALFGPTDPARNGPAFTGADALMLRHRTSTLSHRRLAGTEPGLALITVAEVFAAAQSQLRATVTSAEPAYASADAASVPTDAAFAPTDPAFAPTDPALAPTDPAFVPTDPAFVPNDPAFVPNDPGALRG